MAVDVGDPAPDFTTVTDDGREISLHDLRGKTVVLYFYPRADTPGCTTEACGIRDEFPGFERVGAEVLGVSPDTKEAQAAFKAKYHLPFTLLADPDHEIADAYGVWVLRQSAGREWMGVARTTYIIGPDGKIERVFQQVKPAEHAKELLEALATPA
jgi:thioredoxin-dependent peroxiredoxin